MKNEDQGIDLSPLDPENDPDRLERVVGRVLERLGPGIVEEAPSLALQVAQSHAGWFRPVFTAASLVALAAGLQLVRGGSGTGDPENTGTAMVRVPGDWSSWVDTGTLPTTEELLFSLALEDR